jgi:hypothetical protein
MDDPDATIPTWPRRPRLTAKPGDYRCEHCGKWAVAEHTFRTMLTCIYGGAPTKDGDPWDQHDSDAVVERMTRRLEL